jgi:hypothetical protein
MSMNFSTFATAQPGLLTFRVLGFGVLLFNTNSPLAEAIERTVWGVPVMPTWKFAFVAPWL